MSFDSCFGDSNSSSVVYPHYCEQCPYASFVSGFLDRHKTSSRRDDEPPTVGPSTRPDRFDCDHCQYSFSTERHLVLHTRLKHKKAVCKNSVDSRMHSHAHEDMKYFDNLATSTAFHGQDASQFSGRSSQTTPADKDKTSPEREPLDSSLSDAESTQLTSPGRGLKPRNYVCSLCPYRATQKSALNVHFRRHTGEKPYACRTCNYKCAALNSLVVHNRIHTGEKPYKCHVCEKAFTQAGSLKAHHRVHKIV